MMKQSYIKSFPPKKIKNKNHSKKGISYCEANKTQIVVELFSVKAFGHVFTGSFCEYEKDLQKSLGHRTP